MEGVITEYNFLHNVHDVSEFTFDVANDRSYYAGQPSKVPGTKAYNVIMDYKNKVMYKWTLTSAGAPTGCTKKILSGGSLDHNYAIPPSAEFVKQSELGTYNEGMTVNEFAWKTQVGDDNLYYQVVTTAHSCVPVTEQLYYKNSTKTGDAKLDEYKSFIAQYSDIVLGISNPNVFIPPRSCPP